MIDMGESTNMSADSAATSLARFNITCHKINLATLVQRLLT